MSAETWTTAFNSIRSRLFSQLSEPEREMIALLPAGQTAGKLAGLAWAEAERGLTEKQYEHLITE